MLWILIAFLKACTQFLTFIVRAIEKWPQRNKRNSYAQTGITLHPNFRGVIGQTYPNVQIPRATAPPPPVEPKAQQPPEEAPVPPPKAPEQPLPKAKAATPNAKAKQPMASGLVYPKCPKCNERMITKRAHHGGTFFGCSKWPACNGSRSWRDHKDPNSEPENT